MAHPALIRMKPSLDENFSRSIYISPVSYYIVSYRPFQTAGLNKRALNPKDSFIYYHIIT